MKIPLQGSMLYQYGALGKQNYLAQKLTSYPLPHLRTHTGTINICLIHIYTRLNTVQTSLIVNYVENIHGK